MGRTGIFVAATVAAALAAAPAFADFGAIAYDQHNCAVGRSWNFPSQQQAASKALAECGHRGCNVILEVGPGQCGAIAITPDCHGYGWAKRPSRDAARLAAMQSCQHYNAGQCEVRTSDCNH